MNTDTMTGNELVTFLAGQAACRAEAAADLVRLIVERVEPQPGKGDDPVAVSLETATLALLKLIEADCDAVVAALRPLRLAAVA